VISLSGMNWRCLCGFHDWKTDTIKRRGEFERRTRCWRCPKVFSTRLSDADQQLERERENKRKSEQERKRRREEIKLHGRQLEPLERLRNLCSTSGHDWAPLCSVCGYALRYDHTPCGTTVTGQALQDICGRCGVRRGHEASFFS